ncbi:inorganic phosphate transporter [Haloarcula sp. H-GB4]|nr:inorganic phosphate transporter [Haloarcula sp. H-GB4]MDQ2074483.1 inorganic phosphate transporter [Haloarcula sp. H-GB4]
MAGLGAILQGGSISETIGKDLVTGVTITPLAAAAALLTAATLITIGNTYGYPIPSAFTAAGAMIGAGIALGGDSLSTSTSSSSDSGLRFPSLRVSLPTDSRVANQQCLSIAVLVG